MGKGKLCLVVVSALLALFCLSSSALADDGGTLPGGSTENVRFEVDRTTAAPGERVTVSVYIDGIAQQVHGASFDFVFDPAVVDVINNGEGLPVSPGTVFPRYATDPSTNQQVDLATLVNKVVDNADGTRTLSFAMVLLPPAEPPDLSGSGNLFASFVLEAKTPDTSGSGFSAQTVNTVDFNVTTSQAPDWMSGGHTVNFKLADADAKPITFTAASSSFTISSEPSGPSILGVVPSRLPVDVPSFHLGLRVQDMPNLDPGDVLSLKVRSAGEVVAESEFVEFMPEGPPQEGTPQIHWVHGQMNVAEGKSLVAGSMYTVALLKNDSEIVTATVQATDQPLLSGWVIPRAQKAGSTAFAVSLEVYNLSCDQGPSSGVEVKLFGRTPEGGPTEQLAHSDSTTVEPSGKDGAGFIRANMVSDSGSAIPEGGYLLRVWQDGSELLYPANPNGIDFEFTTKPVVYDIDTGREDPHNVPPQREFTVKVLGFNVNGVTFPVDLGGGNPPERVWPVPDIVSVTGAVSQDGTEYTPVPLPPLEEGCYALALFNEEHGIRDKFSLWVGVYVPEISIAPSSVVADEWPHTLSFSLGDIQVTDPNELFVFVSGLDMDYGSLSAEKMAALREAGPKYSKEQLPPWLKTSWLFFGPAVYDVESNTYRVDVTHRLDVGPYRLSVLQGNPFGSCGEMPEIAWGKFDVVPPEGVWVDRFVPWSFEPSLLLPEGYDPAGYGWALNGGARAYNYAGVDHFELHLVSKVGGVDDPAPIDIAVDPGDARKLSWQVPGGIPAGNYEAVVRAYDASDDEIGSFVAGRFVVGYPYIWDTAVPYLPAGLERFWLPVIVFNMCWESPEDIALVIKDSGTGNEVARGTWVDPGRSGPPTEWGPPPSVFEVTTSAGAGLADDGKYELYIVEVPPDSSGPQGQRVSFPHPMEATASAMLMPEVYPPIQQAGAVDFFLKLRGFNIPLNNDAVRAELTDGEGNVVARSTEAALFSDVESGSVKLRLLFRASDLDDDGSPDPIPEGHYGLELLVRGQDPDDWAPAIKPFECWPLNCMEFTSGVYFYSREPGMVNPPAEGQEVKVFGWNLAGNRFQVEIRDENDNVVWSSPEDQDHRLVPQQTPESEPYQEYISFVLPELPAGRYCLSIWGWTESGERISVDWADLWFVVAGPPGMREFTINPDLIQADSLPEDVTFDLNGVVDYSGFTSIHYAIGVPGNQTHEILAQGQAAGTGTAGVYRATIPETLAPGGYVVALFEQEPTPEGPPPFAIGFFRIVAADTEGPQITGLEPADGSTIDNAKPTLRFTVSDPSGVDWSTLDVALDGEHITPRFVTTDTDPNTRTYTYTPTTGDPSLAEGSHDLVVKVADSLGNWTNQAGSVNWSFTVDILADYTISVDTDKDAYVPGETVTVSGSVRTAAGNPAPGLVLGANITDSLGEVADSSQVTADANGLFSYTYVVPADATAYGEWSITVAVSGATGEGRASFEVYCVLAPAASKVHLVMNPPGQDDVIYGAEGAVQAGATVKVYGYDGTTGQTTLIGSVTAGSDGSFAEMSVGDNAWAEVRVTSTMWLNDVEYESDPLVLLNDIVAPQITDLCVSRLEMISVSRPVSISATSNESVTWRLEVFNPFGQSVAVFTKDGATEVTWEWAPDAGVGTGEYCLVITAQDVAGNDSAEERTLDVYNFPLRIVQIRTLDNSGNEKTTYYRNQFVLIEFTLENLDESSEVPMGIVQVKDSSGVIVGMGIARTTLGGGGTTVLAAGTRLSSTAALGTYTAEVLVWNKWANQGTPEEPFRILSGKGTRNFNVSTR